MPCLKSFVSRAVPIAGVLVCLTGCDMLVSRFKAREAADKFHAGDFAGAARKFDEANRLDPNHPTLLLNTGTTNLALFRATGNKTPEGQSAATRAIAAYERYLERRPNDERVKAALIQTFIETNRYEDAVSFFRPSVDKNPPNLESLGILATVATKCGKADEARKWHQKRIDAAPTHPDGYLALGVFLWQEMHDHPAWTHDKRKELGDVALERLKKAIELAPAAPNAYTYANLVYRELSATEPTEEGKKRDLEEANKYFQMALERQKKAG
jgi:tetratricopeptide (TPR) repeat protein